MKHKLLAVFLALVMTLSLLPTAAFAVDAVDGGTLPTESNIGRADSGNFSKAFFANGRDVYVEPNPNGEGLKITLDKDTDSAVYYTFDKNLATSEGLTIFAGRKNDDNPSGNNKITIASGANVYFVLAGGYMNSKAGKVTVNIESGAHVAEVHGGGSMPYGDSSSSAQTASSTINVAGTVDILYAGGFGVNGVSREAVISYNSENPSATTARNYVGSSTVNITGTVNNYFGGSFAYGGVGTVNCTVKAGGKISPEPYLETGHLTGANYSAIAGTNGFRGNAILTVEEGASVGTLFLAMRGYVGNTTLNNAGSVYLLSLMPDGKDAGVYGNLTVNSTGTVTNCYLDCGCAKTAINEVSPYPQKVYVNGNVQVLANSWEATSVGEATIPDGTTLYLSNGATYTGNDTEKVVQQYTITASVDGENGTITPSGAVVVNPGESKTFNFAPATGYEVSSVKVDGSDVDATTYYEFTNVTANHTIVVAFAEKAPEPVPVESVALNTTNMTLHSIGASNTTTPLTATVTPANATDKSVTFSSSDEKVATVDQNGYVVAVGAGTAIITATVGGKTATCTVTVELKPAESHTIVTDTFTLDFGDAVVEEMTIPLGNALEAEETEVKVVRLGYGAAFTFTSRMTRRNWITYAELYQRSPGEAGYYKCTGVWDDESTVATEQNKPYTITFPSRQQIEDTFKSLDEYEIDLSDAEILYHYAVMEENAESWELDPDVVGEFFVILTDEDTPEPQKATVTFNSNGGSAVASQTVTVGGTAQKPADPTRTGYTFAGWYTDEACTMAYTFGEPVTADLTLYAKWAKNSTTGGGGGGSSSGGSSSSSETTKNPDGSTTTTTTDKTTGTVTEVTKEKDGTTTTVETKKDGTVTETVKTPNGTTGTVVTDKNGDVTEAKATVSTAAAKEAAKTGEAVTLPVEVPAVKTTEEAPALQVTVPKSAGSVKVEIPVEKVTPGTVAVIVNADGTEKIVSTSMVTENGVTLNLDGNATVKIIDNSKTFSDVPKSNVFYNEISSLSAREIMIGKTDDKFDLHNSVTLNQIANVAGRITGDVDVKDFNAGVSWGNDKGLKTGNEPATRGDVLKALYIAAGSPAVEDTSVLNRFNDAASIPADMAAIAAWAAQNGILKGGLDGNANLGVNVTRGQACALAGRTMGTLA